MASFMARPPLPRGRRARRRAASRRARARRLDQHMLDAGCAIGGEAGARVRRRPCRPSHSAARSRNPARAAARAAGARSAPPPRARAASRASRRASIARGRAPASELPPIQIGIGLTGCGSIRMSSMTAGMWRAGKADRVLAPHRPHHRDALVHAPAALAERHAERGELGLDPADPGAEDQPPLGQVLQCRQFLGERQRMAHRQHQHAGAEPDPLGEGRRPGQGQDRVVEDRRGRVGRALWNDDVLARPDIGKAELLGLDRRPPDRLRPGLAPDMRQMNPDPHDPPSEKTCRAKLRPRRRVRKRMEKLAPLAVLAVIGRELSVSDIPCSAEILGCKGHGDKNSENPGCSVAVPGCFSYERQPSPSAAINQFRHEVLFAKGIS